LSAELSDDAVWLTEGELKADLCAERLGAILLSIPGVGNWRLALADLCELRPGAGRVVVALDSDWRSKAAVHDAIWNLGQASAALGYEVDVALWDTTYKGLDDLLTAGFNPELHRLIKFPEPVWTPKLSSRVLARAPIRQRATAVNLETIRARIVDVLGSSYPSL
jgi:hypothetical protein